MSVSYTHLDVYKRQGLLVGLHEFKYLILSTANGQDMIQATADEINLRSGKNQQQPSLFVFLFSFLVTEFSSTLANGYVTETVGP